MVPSQTLARNTAMLTERKTNIRKQMKLRLKAMDQEEKQVLDQQICDRVLSLSELKDAGHVYGYMNLTWETGTEKLLDQLWERGVQIALPKVLGETMEFFHVGSKSDLKIGTFRILEPDESCEQVCWPKAPVLVPGIAFTRDGKRLGKGGGYYDKFFAAEPEHTAIALAYDYQILDDLPSAEHDQSVDLIVTESGIYR